MKAYPERMVHYPAPIGSITTAGWEAGSYGDVPAGYDVFSAAATVQNKRVYIPVLIPERVLVQGMGWLNGATINGNVDASVYDVSGNLLIDTGSTAQSGATAIQTVNVTDTELLPGNYFLSLVSDSATGTFSVINMATRAGELLGCFEQAAAFTAPNPATFAAPSGTWRFPWISAFIRPVF